MLGRVVGCIHRQQEIHQVGCSSSKREEERRADIKGSKRYDRHRKQQTQLVLPPSNRKKLQHRKVLKEVPSASLELSLFLLLVVGMLGGDMFFMDVKENHIVLDG